MMNAGDIAFPHLGIYLENVPRSFSVFGFEIAFYGLIIGIGVLAGILMAVHQAKVTGENPDTIWDFAIYAVIFSVIGSQNLLRGLCLGLLQGQSVKHLQYP